MSLTATKKPPPPLTSSPYPFAAAPDIIRAHQKDAYFQGVLTNQLTDLHRRVRGARSAHSWATETRTAADLLYLCLTTLIGNRTLGEEYCDLVQVEEPSPGGNGRISPDAQHPIEPSSEAGGPRLPSLQRRAGYIVSSVLVPYLFGRLLPSIRAFLRKRLQDRLTVLARQGRGNTKGATPSDSKKGGSTGFSTVSTLEYRVKRYLLTHLTSITSGAHLHALTLAVFYFSGAYYSFSKRLFGLRYVFTRRIEEGQGGRAGYEVLGVLLLVQMLVRGYLHVTAQLSSTSPLSAEEASTEAGIRERAFGPDAGGTLNVSLDENAYSSNNELLVGEMGTPGAGSGNQRSLAEIGRTTHTPVPKGGRAMYDLAANEEVMGWIKGRQQRMCTLCLEELKDPAATQCGHVFCWSCIGDWVREKPECPLCRRETMVQHILPLRVA